MWNFNHLLGRGASASEDDQDDKQKSKKAKSRAEEDDKDKEDAEDDDQDDGKDDNKKEGKKAKSNRADDSDDDDDDADVEEDDGDEKDDDKKEGKKARKAERDRCAKIFASQHAAGRPALAANLAFNTNMSAAAAIEVLAAASPEVSAGRKSLDARMQELPAVKIGPDGEAEGQSTSALVSRATSLYNQAKGRK